MKCPRCSKDAPHGSVVCPFCATPFDEAPTSLPEPDAPTAAPPGPDAPTVAPPGPDAPTVAPVGVDEAVTSMPQPDEAPTSVDPQPLGSAAVPPAGQPAAAQQSVSPPTSSSPSGMSLSASDQHGRFLPGTTVAGRYRVVGLLGRGGMGEVYRADDLKLGQQVALKFLPREAAVEADHVERLLDEVRMARRVSHPNVCRVFDVGEADGHHYVSMEYVDGEDLASLLRRIGRLPEDKAVEIARQLCAALAAAHDEGVLHRDLKPANIMLDGRGRVKLTDFGLAAVAEVRAGTPIYMAPEQLAGEEVSVKSDLYAVGLVLHELFTGKRIFDADDFEELARQHESSLTISRTSSGELDPAIDRIIHRCIQEDPSKRPDSALAVAAALPGADPLAAALAAGETPSPEMVAEAGGEGSLPLAIAAPLLLLSLVCAIGAGVLQSRVSLVGWVPFDMSPALLDARAQEIVAELGYATEFVDSAGAFAPDLGYVNWLAGEQAAAERWEAVRGGRPASIHFWWRGSPRVLVPLMPQSPSSTASVSLSNPARTTPGMVSLQTDTSGRLVWLDVVPNRTAEAAPAAADWEALFELMGLEMANFTPVEPLWLPDHFADERVAWEGFLAEDPEVTLRIEAAAFGGRVISLRWFTPYDPLVTPVASRPPATVGLGAVVAVILIVAVLAMFLTVIFGALYVARRNVRSGRGDGRGARRLALGIAVALGVEWLLSEHTVSLNDVNAFMYVLVFAGAVSGLTWAMYLAVEPFMRRHAPRALIGWTRFIDGRLADPLVGRDVLLGCAAGALSQLLWMVPMALGERADAAVNYPGLPFSTITEMLGAVTTGAIQYVLFALGMLFLYGLTFVGSGRRPWAAYAVWLLFFGGIGFVPGVTVNGLRLSTTPMVSIFWFVCSALWLFVLFRVGILAYVVMGITTVLLAGALPTLDFSAWYASTIIAGLLLFFALSSYAFFRCVAWKGGLAEALAGE